MGTTLLITLGSIIATFVLLWIISLPLRNASIVDPFWGTGFVAVAWLTYGLTSAESWRSFCLLALITIWGLRLSLYLLRRNLGHGEDRRYAAMRDANGPNFWWISLLTVFLLQAVILWVISFPVQVSLVIDDQSPFGLIDMLGLTVWCVGLVFEAVGDWQLAQFRANPENAQRVLDRGLWRYTRHPNYFGDCCIWWGLYLIASAGGAGWTIFSPLLMTLLLMKVSGVTLLEQTLPTRRPEYAAYQARTSPFFPWPQRKVRES